MESNEYDIFSELEHEMGRDLTQWRRHIVTRFEKCCHAALEIEQAKADPFDLTDPSVYSSIKRHTIDFLIRDLIEAEDAPRLGDFISITGESYWRATDSIDDLSTYRLPIGYTIQGPLRQWDVLPYIDEAGLEARVHRDPKLANQHTHPFGLHLVLDHPAIMTDTGRLLPTYPDKIYLPVHYRRATLTVYPND